MGACEKMKFIFIADFFVEHVLGGGELNNEQCIEILSSQGYTMEKIQSHLVTPSFIENNKENKFIIGNFINIKPDSMQKLLNTDYVIYEHDHKYLTTRNPALYMNFKAPKEHIANYEFYQKAKKVFCQSQFHLEIVQRNTGLQNLVNLSGNLWSSSSLKVLEKISKKPKEAKCSIMDSAIPHKNTHEAVNLCIVKNLDYELIQSAVYEEFLEALGANEKFVFLPQTPETLSRVAVEARMMNMSLITNNLVGATKEDWFKLKGVELIEEVRTMRNRIPNLIVKALQ